MMIDHILRCGNFQILDLGDIQYLYILNFDDNYVVFCKQNLLLMQRFRFLSCFSFVTDSVEKSCGIQRIRSCYLSLV